MTQELIDNQRNSEDLAKPALFGMVGWSWLVMGVLGMLFSLLGLLSANQFQAVNMAQNFNLPPGLEVDGVLVPSFDLKPLLETMGAWARIISVVQLVLSGVLVVASWEFLKRKNWARYFLSFTNALSAVIMIAVGVVLTKATAKMAATIPPDLLMMPVTEVVAIFNGAIWFSVGLMILPVIWMAWYLHSRRVATYFTASSVSPIMR